MYKLSFSPIYKQSHNIQYVAGFEIELLKIATGIQVTLDDVQKTLTQHGKILRQLQTENKKGVTVDCVEAPKGIDLPLTSKDDIAKIEEHIQDPSFKKSLVKIFQKKNFINETA